MKTPRHQIADVLGQKLLKSTVSRKQLSDQIASYLLREGRVAELESLLRDIVEFRAAHGIVEVTASSAIELSKQDKIDIENIAKQLYPDAKTVILNQQTDQSLIGGVKLEVVSHQLDVSIKSRLNRLKQLTGVQE
jgi:F0F1-type ATP synthase delta subunit